jgi:hypothetical protein
MTADLVSFRGTPNGCSDTNVSLQIDRAKLTWLPNVHEPLKDDANFSGMSGGPCFRLIPAEKPHRARRNHLRRTLGHRDCVREADNADF